MLNHGDHDYDGLIYLNVHMDVVVDRVCGRRVHMPSGRVYHVNYAPLRLIATILQVNHLCIVQMIPKVVKSDGHLS